MPRYAATGEIKHAYQFKNDTTRWKPGTYDLVFHFGNEALMSGGSSGKATHVSPIVASVKYKLVVT
jgi:hypothetical protein